MEVGTARTRLFKVGALVQASHRRIWFRLASHWPYADLLRRASLAVDRYVRDLHALWGEMKLFVQTKFRDPHHRARIHFAPVPR